MTSGNCVHAVREARFRKCRESTRTTVGETTNGYFMYKAYMDVCFWLFMLCHISIFAYFYK